MQTTDLILFLVFLGGLVAVAPALGQWMAGVLEGDFTRGRRGLPSVEGFIYRLAGVHPDQGMSWGRYAASLVLFNMLGLLVVAGLQLFQSHLPLNTQGLADVPWPLALNTAISFVTNTNWQAYSGEATLSYLTQMLGLGVQNFLSAATGLAVLLALARGLVRRTGTTLGNFWVDVTRSTLYVLLPLSFIFALVLVGQGVVQTFHPYVDAHTLEGVVQQIPLGPAASQIAIKQLGTNGGGFFGVNSAHPFENPTPLANLLELWAILLLPAALPFTYGRLVHQTRHAWCLFAAMLILLVVGLGLAYAAEVQLGGGAAGGAWEGKEVRHGLASSVLWTAATTAASNGSVNAMHDSLSPLAGMVALLNILLGEVIFGGVGAGLYGMLAFVILAVFLAGLMVGRTPEYLGKKLGLGEVLWAAVAVLMPCAVVLVGSWLTLGWPDALASRTNAGPHGFSEILYAWASAAGNNGSAFAGLNANTIFFNLGLGLAMLIGRYAVIIPMLAVAGRLVQRPVTPPSPGTFPTDGLTFVALLVAVILIVGGLTFLPALALGPVTDHLLWLAGRTL